MKRLLLFFICLSWTAGAQEPPAKNVRFLPLGEIPPHEEIRVDGRRVQKPPPKGSMPPMGTVLLTEPEESVPLGLRLNTFTKSMKIKASAKGVKIFPGGQIAGNPWFQSKFPADKQALFVLCKDNANMSWEKPQLKVLKEDLRSFPIGRIRFANVSDREVGVIIGNEKVFLVKPGDVVLRPLKVGNTLVKIAVQNAAGAWKQIRDSEITMRERGRIQAFFYKAQTKDVKKTPVKFYSKLERF